MDLIDKSVLVVDCYPEYRNSIKNTMSQLGSKVVHTVPNADRAIEKVEEYDYDVIISEYALGVGKNGQELIEELRHNFLIKPTTIFGVVSAENTSWIIFGIVEQRPDFYLRKPFKNSDLINRLEFSMERKKELHSIEQALLSKEYESAIKYCDLSLLKKTKYPMDVLKLRAEALLGWEKYEDAARLYTKILQKKSDLSWALVGLGKAHFELENYHQSIGDFNAAINCPVVHLDAYDWLSKSYLILSSPKKAQSALEAAVRLSPKSILRLQRLCDLSLRNGDKDVAKKSLRNVIKEGKNSCFKRVDDSLNLAILEFEKNPIMSFQVLNDSAKEFRNDNIPRLRIEIKKSVLLFEAKKKEDAQKSLARAEAMYDALTEKNSLILLEFSEAYLAFDFLTEANESVGKIVIDDLDNVSKNQYHKLIHKLKELPKFSYNTLNEKGVSLFKNGSVIDAFDNFQQAAKGKPREVSYSLNAAQALIMLIKDKKVGIEKLKEASFYIKNCQDLIDRSDDNYARLLQLIKIHKTLG